MSHGAIGRTTLADLAVAEASVLDMIEGWFDSTRLRSDTRHVRRAALATRRRDLAAAAALTAFPASAVGVTAVGAAGLTTARAIAPLVASAGVAAGIVAVGVSGFGGARNLVGTARRFPAESVDAVRTTWGLAAQLDHVDTALAAFDAVGARGRRPS